jgi:tetratricopeptide (TPR) repeat protein
VRVGIEDIIRGTDPGERLGVVAPRTLPGDDAKLTTEGIALGKSGRFDEAVKFLTQALEINQGNALAHYNLALAYQAQGEMVNAIREHQRALGIDPGLARAHRYSGPVLKIMGGLDEAIQQYQKTVDTSPNDASVHYNLGLAYDIGGFCGEAEKEYWEAISIDPGRYDAYARLELLYDYQRRYSADRKSRVVDGQSNTPAILDGARVLLYAELDSSERLAICQYDGQSGRYVFYCDCRWNVHGADLWGSVEECIDITERSLRVTLPWRCPRS